MDSNEEKRLTECLNAILQNVDAVLTQLKSKKEFASPAEPLTTTSRTQSTTTNVPINDVLFDNSVQNNNVNTFTVDIDEEELLNTLTIDIQNILKDRLSQLSNLCSSYLEQFLHEYHFDKDQRVFTQELTAGILYTLQQNLKGLLMAATAYPAALTGDRPKVQKFLQLHSNYKDKSGFWGTTLLWSAARGGHFNLVKYLIESAGCSVNAQNQSDINYALITDSDTARPDATILGYEPDPKAASTALHAACFSNNLEIVKYLIGKGANYFLRNQLGETPIQNGQNYSAIREFFQDYLVLNYTNTPSTMLPSEAILDCHVRKPNNCVWEYKPIKGLDWEEFTMSEHNTLSNSLRPVENGETFNTSIYLSARQSTYPVNLLTFLRGGKNQEPNPSNKDSQAWIRCRGSSIANFDIHCIWQLMLVQHNTQNQSNTNTQMSSPSLESITIPSVYDSKFQIKLNSWYTCNSKINDLLDETINYRRRYVNIDCHYIGNFTCNLHAFTFANDTRTILGFIRWIPKFIANTPNNQNIIKDLDNFQAINQWQPVPLTTKRLEQSVRTKVTSAVRTTTNDEENSADNLLIVEDEANDDDDENNRTTSLVNNNGTWNLSDILNNDSEMTSQHEDELPTTTTDTSTVSEIASNAKDYIDKHMSQLINRSEPIAIHQVSDTNNRAEQDDAILRARNALEAENEQLKSQKFALERQMSEQLRNLSDHETTNQEIINSTINTLEDTQQKLDEKLRYEQLINETAKEISIVEYTLPNSNQSIIFILNSIRKVLKAFDYPHKDYFKNSVPLLDIDDRNDRTMILRALPIHHEQIQIIFVRLHDLFNRTQSIEAFCELQTNGNVRSLITTIEKVRPENPRYWRYYKTILIRLIRENSSEYINKFKQYVTDQLKLLLKNCIENSSVQYRQDVENLLNNYTKTETFISTIEGIKSTALDQFIRDHLSLQEKSAKTIPTKTSISTLNTHINKIKKNLSTMSTFKGIQLKHFQMIPPLLQRIMIYYNCFLLQLPLFDSSIDLLKKIETSTVLTIQTSTGSGKSTLLPSLLIAEGYDKVLVTQPRRLPCNLISKRVNSMVNDDISGWAVSGAEENVQAKILYITDGLLKERLLNDENLITKNTTLNRSVVFFIDEVHERSINIDLCLALFARLLKLNPELKNKMKVIISSATLDPSVPKLYKDIPGCSVSEFNLISLSTLYEVTDHHVPNTNILELVQQLYSKRIRHDQILCFVGSTQEVHENCQLLRKITNEAIIAYPLVQSQSAADQQKYITEGTVFFSTTVAETSLTFPCLKYVIDTGLINMPVYSLQLKRTELNEIKAAQSTTKQRRGRLGRTQPGEYYALYKYQPGEQRAFPEPQICQSELVNIEFTLRKSRLKTNLRDFKQYLPNQPEQPFIDDAIQQLKTLGLVQLNSSENFTNLGALISKLPDFSSLPMSKAVHSALKKHRCGRDLILLSSVLSVLNTSAILKSIPAQYKSPEGDLMTLLNVMNTIVLVRDSVPPQQFNVDRVCNAKGLSGIAHVIKQALRRYKNLERAFNLSDEFRQDAQIQSGNWENIARALLEGFSDKVFVSLKMLQGKNQQFLKYNAHQRTSNTQQQEQDEPSTIAVIDRSSTLRTGNKGLLPASLVLARDVRYLTAIRSTAILSFVGKVELTWLEYKFTREVKLNEAEEQKLNTDNILQNAIQKFTQVDIHIKDRKLVIRGSSGHILNAELYIRQQLVTSLTFTLSSDQPNNSNDNLTRNLKSVTSMPIDLFGPLRWRWEAEQQVKIRTKMNAKQGTIDVTVEGLDSQNRAVQKEFNSFLRWLRTCAVIRDPHSGVAPRVLKPQIRDAFQDMEDRIARITDPNRTTVDRWKSLQGPDAKRETRMEVVAWIAVCLFDCRLEGGFVRDWIVGGYSKEPSNLPPQQWVQLSSGLPVLNRELVPSDLDCHLPASKQFDVEAFIDALHDYKITARSFRQDWRYVLLIDENSKTGPFTMDLIEPHIALTHDRIDFDVSNLSLEKKYTKDLGMRVDITGGSHSIQLETIVENIRKKHFQVLRPIDGENGPNTSGTVAERIEKMKFRGWTQIGKPLPFIPNPPPTYNAILVPYPSSTVLYQNIVDAMKKIPGAKVLSIEQIKNPDIESLYENMKKTIAKECPVNNDPNERELFHGTKADAVEGIINRGYDDRYYSQSGAWGRGAYFADDPRKSNGYAPPHPETQRRVIFYNKVLLGVESVQNTTNNQLGAAPLDHHSVHGAGGWEGFQYHEYIVYRYGQALPYLKITYTAPA